MNRYEPGREQGGEAGNLQDRDKIHKKWFAKIWRVTGSISELLTLRSSDTHPKVSFDLYFTFSHLYTPNLGVKRAIDHKA
jgi:hypothetical protein